MNEVICGHYCTYVLHRMSNGDDFYDIYVMSYTIKKYFFCYNIMSVDIFGSSGTFPHDVNNHYADQKFTTLSSNLTLKVNKSGDTMAGDLTLLVNDDQQWTFGVSDLSSGKDASLLLSDQNNLIRHNFGHPLKIAAVYGTKFTCHNGDICRMGAENDVRTHFYQDVVMNNKYIARLRDPFSTQDASTKKYTDLMIIYEFWKQGIQWRAVCILMP